MLNEEKDFYTTLGAITELMAASIYHRQQKLKSYFYFQIFPTIRCQQFSVFYSANGSPQAFVTWAWLKNEAIEEMAAKEERFIEEFEWSSGTVLFFNDFIAPYGDMRTIFKHIFINVFPKEKTAYSIRRKNDGGVRKKNTWHRHRFVHK